LGTTPNALVTKKGHISSTFTPTIEKKIKFEKMMVELNKGKISLDLVTPKLPQQQ